MKWTLTGILILATVQTESAGSINLGRQTEIILEKREKSIKATDSLQILANVYEKLYTETYKVVPQEMPPYEIPTVEVGNPVVLDSLLTP